MVDYNEWEKSLRPGALLVEDSKPFLFRAWGLHQGLYKTLLSFWMDKCTMYCLSDC